MLAPIAEAGEEGGEGGEGDESRGGGRGRRMQSEQQGTVSKAIESLALGVSYC